MKDMLAALAAAPGSPPGPSPLSPTPMGPPEVSGEAETPKESETLGELAMAFREATDPRDAANILIEFLDTAGYQRK